MVTKRTFLPCDNWVYYKIYGGIDILDTFLVNEVNKFLKANKYINQFFFIRYRDPSYHFRLRFFIEDKDRIGELIISFNKLLSKHTGNGTIWDVSINTYTRELERFFGNLTPIAERFFSSNSRLIIDFLKHQSEDNRYLFGLIYADCFLDYFFTDQNQKLECVSAVLNSFKIEFAFNKNMQVQMDQKFRTLGKPYLEFAFDKSTNPDLCEILSKVEISFNSLKEPIKVTLNSLGKEELFTFVHSVLHMHFNRLFKTRQRQCEFMSYYFLHKTLIALEKRK